MRTLFARFRYSNMFAKISHPGMSIRNQLFQLTDSQNKLLSAAWQTNSNNNIKTLHDQVMTTIPQIDGLTVLKSVALHYMQINCQHQKFWLDVGNQLEKVLLMKNWQPKTYSYFYQLAFIFGQIKRKALIKDEQIMNQYKKCSEIVLRTIQHDVLNQNPQNISHIVSLISQYDIEGPYVTKIAEQLQGKTNFSKFTIQDLVFYFWALKTSTNQDFLKIGVFGFHNEEVINIIQTQWNQLDQNLWSKLLIIIAQFKPRNEKFLNFIVDKMPVFELKQLVSLIAIYIKTPFNQSQCLFPILLSLKTQFTDHFENENKDPQITCDGIKFLTFIPAQMSLQHRLLLADKLDIYGKFIVYNLQHFDQTHLIDVICMANCFKQKEQMLELIKSRLENIQMNLDVSIFFLLNIVQYESMFTQKITDCLNQLNGMKKQIQELHEDKHLQLMLALNQLEDKYPMAKQLLYLKDKTKLIRQLQGFVNKFKRESIISDTGLRLHFKFYEGFMSNNFEFNLYICEKLGVFKYVKEARINLHLLDYRLYDIKKDKFNLAKLKQMQQDQNLLNEFLKYKYEKFDDVKIDRENDEQSLFIEVDGQNHYDLMGQPINRTVCKKEQLKKSNLIIHTISLDENIEIQNSLKTIQEILDK